MHKKHKNTNKRISYSFPFRCFLSAFFIFVFLFAFLLCAFVCFLVLFVLLVVFGAFGGFWCFLCFLVLFCACEIFLEKTKKKEFKTALITSFILLLVLDIDDKQEFSKPRKFAFIPFFFKTLNIYQGALS